MLGSGAHARLALRAPRTRSLLKSPIRWPLGIEAERATARVGARRAHDDVVAEAVEHAHAHVVGRALSHLAAGARRHAQGKEVLARRRQDHAAAEPIGVDERRPLGSLDERPRDVDEVLALRVARGAPVEVDRHRGGAAQEATLIEARVGHRRHDVDGERRLEARDRGERPKGSDDEAHHATTIESRTAPGKTTSVVGR